MKATRLRAMTFEDLQPVYRGDEDSARFAGRRYDTRTPDSRAYLPYVDTYDVPT